MAITPIYTSNEHIEEALKLLGDLGEHGIAEVRNTMSVLIYRLSKALCNADQKGGTSWADRLLGAIAPSGTRAIDLLKADLYAHGIGEDDYPRLKTCLHILESTIKLGVLYEESRVMGGVKPPSDLDDDLYKKQSLTDPQFEKQYASWGRPLPFRPLFCAFSTFAQAFPVLGNTKRYDALDDEDSVIFSGGDDKPKVRSEYQRTFATLLDAVDYSFGYWKSFVKSEPSFNKYSGNQLMMAPDFRPKRKGNCYWRKDKNSISPDLVIVSRHDAAPSRQNITHVVDMKFGADDLGRDQGEKYVSALGAKKLLVLYFPKDCTVSDEPDKRPYNQWIPVLLSVLMLLATRGRGGGMAGGAVRPIPVPH